MKFSIIVPAYNEGKNLEAAVRGLIFFLDKNQLLKDTEILIFNDHSSDNTGPIADRLAKEVKNIRVFHNQENKGLGFNFQEGARQATGGYVSWFPGDNENLPEPFVKLFRRVGETDIIVSYTSNPQVRPILRRIISRLYVAINNFIFGLNLNYYNGLNVYKRDLLLKLPPLSNSFSFAAEILVLLLKSGASYIEIPVEIKPTELAKTSAFRIKNIIKVGGALINLFWIVNIKKTKII